MTGREHRLADVTRALASAIAAEMPNVHGVDADEKTGLILVETFGDDPFSVQVTIGAAS